MYSAPIDGDASTFEPRMLAPHNRERTSYGSAPLRWTPNLAIAAAAYGPALSAMGRLHHSSRFNRPGQAENLRMGTRGSYLPEAMVGVWNAEKRYLRPGTFPFVNATGNWQDVAFHPGHLEGHDPRRLRGPSRHDGISSSAATRSRAMPTGDQSLTARL